MSVNDIKVKFDRLQTEVTKLNNSKIGLDGEVKTLKGSLDEEIAALLQLTGKKDIKEALAYYEAQKQELTAKMAKVNEELDSYLVKDEVVNVSGGNTEFNFDQE